MLLLFASFFPRMAILTGYLSSETVCERGLASQIIWKHTAESQEHFPAGSLHGTLSTVLTSQGMDFGKSCLRVHG